jgi:hypothetical protein
MPKKLKYSKKIQDETSAFITIITSYCNKINKEYLKNMNALIEDIAIGENLDPEMLKDKYLNKKNVKTDSSEDSDTILDKIEFEGKFYFVEPDGDKKVYGEDSKIVGKMVNNKIELFPVISQSN